MWQTDADINDADALTLDPNHDSFLGQVYFVLVLGLSDMSMHIAPNHNSSLG